MATTYEASEDIGAAVRACVSASELIAIGFSNDVDVAVERDVDAQVPVLTAGFFTSG
jgi:2-phosphosulfolactate phosphatase